jgi:hypothetical protein
MMSIRVFLEMVPSLVGKPPSATKASTILKGLSKYSGYGIHLIHSQHPS